MIDFSNIGKQYSQSNSTSNSNSTSGLSQEGQNAVNPLLGIGATSMPSHIDAWGANAMNQYRVGANDITNAMNQVANQRASQGIMGGTEANNLRANVLSNLAMPTLQNQANVLQNTMQMKAQAIPQLIGLTQQSNNMGNSTASSYSQSPEDYRIIASMINNQW